MSVIMSSDNHLRLLAVASTLDFHGRMQIDAARTALVTLWLANKLAFESRYGTVEAGCVAPTLAPSLTSAALARDPVLVIKSVQFYRYQCEELPNFDGSEADKLCASALANAYRRLPGYEQLPWGL